MNARTSRADLHVHSSASQETRLGVQRAIGLPECATPPEEVYALAKRRGMDFVTLTDHDTISGALELESAHDDAFVSVELTTRFRGEPRAAVHVLCWGITEDDFAWMTARDDDAEALAEGLHEREIACALAHPFYAVDAPLMPRHRRRLARLFPIWEVRNGSRAPELNAPAAVYVETHGGVGVAGSDDHAGVDIARTFTETPHAATWREMLGRVQAGEARARGDQGSAAKWAHAAMALAIRALGCGDAAGGGPDPGAVLAIVERVVRQGDERGGATDCDVGPEDGRAVLRAFLAAVEPGLDEVALLAELQRDDFAHADLFRRARRVHERRLTAAVGTVVDALTDRGDVLAAGLQLFEACTPALPYAPAAAFLGREKAKLAAPREGEPLRVALVADGVGGMHGVTHTLNELRERGVPGFEVEVIGTDPNVDRRLSAVAEIDIPFYAGLRVGVPTLPGMVEVLADGRYDLVHLVSPGPCGVAAALLARVCALPVVASYHTELAAYTRLRSDDPMLELGVRAALGEFYGRADHVLSPSSAADATLHELEVDLDRVGRWDRGVDIERFGPERRAEGHLPGELTVLYAGRLAREKGVDMLADAFLRAHERDERLHLVLAGGGPEEATLRERLGTAATFLGWLEGDALAGAYASADLFLFASRTDTFGQVLLEAQASGLPVIAVDEGGPRSIVQDGLTGRLVPADAAALAAAVVELAAAPLQRERLARAGLAAARERSWGRAFAQLAEGYRRTLSPAAQTQRRAA